MMPTEPALLPWLPIVYVAWADGELSKDELHALYNLAARRDGVPADAVAMLDPKKPLSATQLADLLAAIRKHGAGLPESERRSLADLGMAIARLGGGDSAPNSAAMRELEDALGVLGSEAARHLVAASRPVPRAGVDRPEDSAGESERADPAALRIGLQTVLDGSRTAIRQQIRAWLGAEENRPVYRLDARHHRDEVRRRLRALAELGVGRLTFPGVTCEHDNMGDFMTAFETLAYGDLSTLVKAGVQWGLFGGSINFLGDDEQRQRYLHDAASCDLFGCFAMTETGHGSNVAELQTVATYITETREFEIHTPEPGARKDYIGGAAEDARMATVFARLVVDGRDHGVHAFVVPIRNDLGQALPGVRILDCGEKLGLHGVDNGRLWFDRVRIPRANLLARYAHVDDSGYHSDIASPSRRFFVMLGTLVGGRISVAAASVSAAKVGLAIAVRYAHQRRQFGAPDRAEMRLIDYRTHQRRLMPRLAATYALHFACSELRERYVGHTGEDNREIETLAAGVKALASWNAAATLQEARECCGGQGYLAVNRIGVVRADTDVFSTFEGDNTVLLQLVAKSLLSGYRNRFTENPMATVVSILARRVRARLGDKNPVAVRRAASDHLRSRSWQERLLSGRVDELLETAAQRLKKRLDRGMSSTEAIVDVQDHLVTLGRAHGEHYVFSALGRAIEGCADTQVCRQLIGLSDLYALSLIERDAGWYFEHDYIEDRKFTALRREINALCGELASESLTLVSAFAIPDTALSAPIAFADPGADEPD